MERLEIRNREDQNVVILVENPQDPRGLAFVMHGLAGFKEQPRIVALAEAFKDRGLTVIRFDTTNTFGESDGKYEDATVTNFYEDLEDVIKWAKTQPWYEKPFYLAGHSLGGISILLYTERHPEEVKGLAPISTVISGKLSAETHGREYLKSWEKTGWREEESTSIPGLVKRLKWSHMVDRLKYDALPGVDKLTMPVLLIVGEEDEDTPLRHQLLLYNKLPGQKELHVIKGAAHSFHKKAQLEEIEEILRNWIDKVEGSTP